VNVVAPSVCDFGVDRFGASFIPRALRSAEPRSILAIVAERRGHCPVAARRKGFKAEINADLAVACRQRVVYLALKCDIPASARILREAASLDLAADLARLSAVEFRDRQRVRRRS
jgi:hypothetical protein